MGLSILTIIFALWLGILTSISPCPLATNIVALSYICKNINEKRNAVFVAMFYTVGRSVTYIALAILIIKSIFSIPNVSDFLQSLINILLGPILIIIGMIFLELFKIEKADDKSNNIFTTISKNKGLVGSFFLGIILALSFCPVSAVIYFGSLIPLAIKEQSVFILPFVYGIGTCLPVAFFALLIVFSADLVTKTFKKVSSLELLAKNITGIIFILVGIYYTFQYLIF